MSLLSAPVSKGVLQSEQLCARAAGGRAEETGPFFQGCFPLWAQRKSPSFNVYGNTKNAITSFDGYHHCGD